MSKKDTAQFWDTDPKHVDDKNTDFLAELLPWSDMLPENIRKPQKASGK